MMRSVVATFIQGSLRVGRNNVIPRGQRHYQSVCGATVYHCSHNQKLFCSCDLSLLVSKPAVINRPSSVEYHVLQKCISSLEPEVMSRCSNSSSDPTLRNVAPPSIYFFSTSNEKESTKSNEQSESEEALKKLTVFQRFKIMLKDYWHVLIPVHVITSIGWFGGFYYLATSGIDIPALMESLNFSEGFVKPFRDSSMGYIAVSYGLYKIATPVRYTITVGGTSIAIRVLKKRGLVQPWPMSINWLKRQKKKEL